MKRASRIAPLLVVLLCLVWLGVPPQEASAHPLGEATISQYSAIMVGVDQVQIRYVVDMAEIPTFQELRAIGPGRSTGADLTQKEREAYISTKSAELVGGLSLTLDGKPLSLSVSKALLTFLEGKGGLPTLRLDMCITASLRGTRSGTLVYRDGNLEGHKGWREIIAVSVPRVSLTNSSVPSKDITNALRVYNLDVTSSPPDVRDARLTFSPGTEAGGASQFTEGPCSVSPNADVPAITWAPQRSDPFANLFNDKTVPLYLMLIIAFGMGAAHAMSPGHGKTVVAAYLVGTRGTALHAGILGLTVTISHTIGVFMLGIIVLSFSQYILPETVMPILSVVSGLLICLVGVTLFAQRLSYWRRTRAEAHTRSHEPHSHEDHTHDGVHYHSHQDEQEHEHAHVEHGHHDDSHSHDHEHPHDPSVPHKHGPFGRAHTHVPSDGQRVTMGSLLTLGITGGIIPCPSALVVLLVAINTNQVALGLLLIVAFSLGLASVLTVLGLMVVYGKGLLGRIRLDSARLRAGAILGRLPMASALAVSCLGILIAFSGIMMR